MSSLKNLVVGGEGGGNVEEVKLKVQNKRNDTCNRRKIRGQRIQNIGYEKYSPEGKVRRRNMKR